MAKFAQYYLKYIKDSFYSDAKWMERQRYFGAFFEKNDSMSFTIGEGEGSKTYKHDVYHLSCNKNIIVMRIANVKTKDVIQNFKSMSVPHEPPCYVIIDNRENCRRIAIQKKKDSFSSTDSLKKILQEVLNKKMVNEHYIGLELHPQFYPRDFYKAWKLRQYSTQSIRFNISECALPANFEREDMDDQYITDFAIKINEEEYRKKYRATLELNPPEDRLFLEVDYSSTFIRNLVKYHANTGASIDIITNDGSRFKCFVDDDEESDSIITNEIENEYLDALFPEDGNFDDEEIRKAITKAENKLIEFINRMKIEANDINDKEEVA